MKILRRRWRLAGRRRRGGRGLGGGRRSRVRRGGRHHRHTRRPGPAIGPAAAGSPDRGERDPGQPEQGDGAAAAVPGDAYAGTPHAEKVWYVLLDASDPGWRTTWA